jgi:hypothetical protein
MLAHESENGKQKWCAVQSSNLPLPLSDRDLQKEANEYRSPGPVLFSGPRQAVDAQKEFAL